MNNKGQALVEYILIIAVVSIAIVSIVKVLSGYIQDSLTKTSCTLVDIVQTNSSMNYFFIVINGNFWYNQIKIIKVVNMRNNKGQALVEFVILIPVLILLILSIFDLGNIILKKYKLENELDTIINYYNNNDEQLMNSYASMKDISIKKERKNNNMIDIKVSYEVNINTPVLNKIMGEIYQIETSRIVYER